MSEPSDYLSFDWVSASKPESFDLRVEPLTFETFKRAWDVYCAELINPQPPLLRIVSPAMYAAMKRG